MWGIRVRVGVRVNYFRDSFSVLLRAHHYSMLTTFGSVSTANDISECNYNNNAADHNSIRPKRA